MDKAFVALAVLMTAGGLHLTHAGNAAKGNLLACACRFNLLKRKRGEPAKPRPVRQEQSPIRINAVPF